MSDDQNQEKPNLRVLEFSSVKDKKETNESHKVMADMFRQLADRAAQGDINDFVITFKSESRGVESMIGVGEGIGNFDFVGYIGMLEVLKQRVMGIMSQMTYAYEFGEDDMPQQPKKQDEPEPLYKKDDKDEPEKT